MFSPIARCSYCADEYEPVEYRTVPQDPDEPRFCSDDCEVRYLEAEDASSEWDVAYRGAAPVFP